jgi:glycosyltransferase involved in cell wall biosynthesis
MREADRRSIRILFDLQACQTAGSAQRGVGRYSKALFEAISRLASPREIHALAGSHHPFPLLLGEFPRQREHLIGALPDWETARGFEGGERDALDAASISAAIGKINPDIVHISHVFEGFADRVAVPCSSKWSGGRLLSATLYDLIPLRFKDHYFQDARFKRWYLQQLQVLRRADLLLSISESSRQDAISLLDLKPSRIVTIHGGISAHFKPVAHPVSDRARLYARYGLTRQRFLLYTGGDDHRKNLKQAIEGYAALPRALRQETHIVILCAIEPHRKSMYLDLARTSGLENNDLLIVGFVPEDDLVAFYTTCDLFVFPSLYEGLGLPILEAMACGAPVVAGDNSSIRELVPEPEALFDASSPAAIANAMHRGLADCAFADRLRCKGLAQAQRFTWQRSAELAIEAFDEALRKKREVGVRAVANGWLERKRIAMFTPLPPCRSGIADYNAGFLPFLAEHLDIDLYVDGYRVSDEQLNASFRIFDAKDFRASAAAYDAILYELGNSEFHVHMLPLMAEFPGIVGLHDAFLSGLIGYLEFNLGEKDRYAREMLHSHAGQARRLFAPIAAHPNAIGESMVDLPCTKRALDQAIGIISHTPFNLKIARGFYPQGWPAPYRIIPQMVAMPEPWSAERRGQVRAELGFAADDFIITTFGHVAWTKCGDRLLEAFLTSELKADGRCYLVFAGELAKDDFGLKLNERIRNSGLGRRISITSFLSEEDYSRYLRITDIAVQLRTKSRGGTPKGVLDCLAHGVPVIVNDEASYADYPEGVVCKLGPDPTAAEIAAALIELRNSPDRRRVLGERGRGYVREHHDPKSCAAQYAAAVTEFAARYAATKAEGHAASLAPHVAGCKQPLHAATTAATFLDTLPAPSFDRERLVIDVSHVARDDHGTGIPRVVRETVKASYCDQLRPGLEAVAIELVNGELVPATGWLGCQGVLLPFETGPTSNAPVALRPGDHLLMLDSSWARYEEFAPVFVRARAARVPVTTAIYDLLPMTLPPGNIVTGGKEWFEAWLRAAIEASDNLVCISRAMADEVIAYITDHGLGRKGLRVGYWHLGADMPITAECATGSPVHGIPKPYALMVGTIEPRKNHVLALDAFEQLWKEGSDLSLVIAGKPGWMVDKIIERLRQHELGNKRLFFFKRVSDAEVAHLYRNAAALLFPSKGEGFGLPLVEAAHYGTPIICSDIPVFREIAGDHATFVQISDARQLATNITDWQRRMSAGETLGSDNMPRQNWRQSAEALIDIVMGQKWYWTAGAD